MRARSSLGLAVLLAALTLALLSLAGLPPLAGFVGKYLVFLVALQADLAWLAILGIAMSLVALGYYVRVVLALWTPPEGAGAPADPPATTGWGRLALGLATAATVWFGFGPSLRTIGIPGLPDLLRWAHASAAALFT